MGSKCKNLDFSLPAVDAKLDIVVTDFLGAGNPQVELLSSLKSSLDANLPVPDKVETARCLDMEILEFSVAISAFLLNNKVS